MVEEIYKLKNELLSQAKKELAERGPDRIDVNRMGEIIDMVKDLAEAEESCWKAQYYRNIVSDAMEQKYGYSDPTQAENTRQGYGSTSMRQGYGSTGMRQGYGSDHMEQSDIIGKLGEEYRRLAPNDRMMMKNKVLAAME